LDAARGIVQIATAAVSIAAERGEGGPAAEPETDEVFEKPLDFCLEDIPVSRRAGEHIRFENQGAPELVFDRNGVSVSLTNICEPCYSC
jgi:hypothetical protein